MFIITPDYDNVTAVYDNVTPISIGQDDDNSKKIKNKADAGRKGDF